MIRAASVGIGRCRVPKIVSAELEADENSWTLIGS